VVTRARVALKFFTLGLLAGVIFAPGSGTETRRRLVSAASDAIGSLFGRAAS
jgi:gas vesicle protein